MGHQRLPRRAAGVLSAIVASLVTDGHSAAAEHAGGQADPRVHLARPIFDPRVIPYDAAGTKPDDMLHTVRCTVEKSRFRTWLNGRFAGEINLAADMNPAGTVKITLSLHSQAVSRISTQRAERCRVARQVRAIPRRGGL